MARRPPKIFHVNWFRKSGEGKFLWPGFGDNMRVLRWIIDRCQGHVRANESPLGWMPSADDIDIAGMKNYSRQDLEQALALDVDGWKREAILQDELFINLSGNLPAELMFQRELLIARL